jgi:hypothetical protein
VAEEAVISVPNSSCEKNTDKEIPNGSRSLASVGIVGTAVVSIREMVG